MPRFCICPTFRIGAEAVPAVPGVGGSKSRLSVVRWYRSSTMSTAPSNRPMSAPKFTERFSSHLRSRLPSEVCRKPAAMVELLPVMS